LHEDASQRDAVAQLQLLQTAVVGRWRERVAAAAAAEAASASAEATTTPTPPPPPPLPSCLGGYLWGDVGTGKTALADLFLRTLPPDIPRRRDHYHAFMRAFHRRQHELLQALPKVAVPTRQGGGTMRVFRSALPEEDPILTAAREIALGGCGSGGAGGGVGGSGEGGSAGAQGPPSSSPFSTPLAVLALDELHVTDVADAMILARLFNALLLDHGVAVLFTSNRPPEALYEGGLSRRYFLPFVRLCEARLLDLRLGGRQGQGENDYRRLGRRRAEGDGGDSSTGVMFVGPGAAEALERRWEEEERRAGGKGAEAKTPISLPVPATGRALAVPRALLPPASSAAAPSSSALAAARFSFDELCGPGSCLSSADYAALVGALSKQQQQQQQQPGAPPSSSPALFLTAVPQRLCPKRQRDEARRLVTLLDVLYDAHAAAAGNGQEADAPPPPRPRLFLSLVEEEGGGGEGGGGGPDSIFEALARERAERAEAAGGGNDDDDDNHLLPPSLLAEEALMYRRAASRLAGLCDVVLVSARGDNKK
jgi:predicted ATPase